MARYLTLSSVVVVLALAVAGCSDQDKKQAAGGAPGGANPAQPVSVVTLSKSVQPLTTVLSGRAEAVKIAANTRCGEGRVKRAVLT